ncbi:MAG: DUF5668 domain-containing protein [Bacteroidota bacterium]
METQKNCSPIEHRLKRFVFGIVIVAVGILLILRNTGALDPFTTDIVFSWQMLLIAIGFINLFGRNKIIAMMTMLVGAAYLIPEFYDLDFNFTAVFWPGLLILGGVLMIFFGGKHFHHFRDHVTVINNGTDDYLEDVVIFGGSERIITSQEFKGGKLVTIFGGLKVDLSQAKLAEGTHTLEVVSVFGGVEALLPSDWNVKTQVVSILGGFSDKRRNINIQNDAKNLLMVKGVAIFGGGEIKSSF